MMSMAARDMTFSIPEEIASLLTRQIDAAGRSRFVTEAVEERLRRKQRLEAACDVVNNDPAVKLIETEWDAVAGDGLEDDAW